MTFFMSGQDIYDNFQQGAGADGISSSAAMVNQLSERHQDRAERLTVLKARMESAWQGAAAGAAQRGLGPLVTEHDLSGHALHTARDLTSRQAGSFGDAKNQVVPVPPAPGEVDPLVVLTNPGTAATYLQQVAAHSQAAQHNVDVMNGYTGASQYNTDGQPASYGDVVDDQAGITIGSPDTIDSEESTSDSGSRDPAPRPGSGGDLAYRPPPGGAGESGARPDASTEPGTGPGTSAGTTRPDSYPVTPPPTGPASPAPGTDSGLGQPRPAPGGGITPGVGIGIPVDGRGSGGGGPRGGAVGGAPRGGGVGSGAGVGAGQPAATGRTGPGVAAATGPGRRGVGFGGAPVGAGGRGRGEEDTERKAPAYLEGGDPDDLFDTDQLTAPPAIGDEED
ncbi:MAG: hypothetical protein GEV28_28280 [Actinophytocola sp.]|uniref:hypothetical protein n=1 Tax=Actinophytocola sp. TaxID=1872138 RepID=UPI001321216E|nr:hypothetical protein [Actinophytocola sp.]MPZ84082.1 hypothetical protein [Actinophytocola sp.]